MENKQQKILVADDHFVVKGGLEMILSKHYSDFQIDFASDLNEILSKIKKHTFDLIILDADFEEDNSINFISDIFVIQPQITILIYSGLDEDLYAPKFFELGVMGFLSKLSNESDIITAIACVLKGEHYLSKNMKDKLLKGLLKRTKDPINTLSKREFEIMSLLAKGNGNLEISNKLNIRPTTISTYKKRIFKKLKITNLSELIELFKIYN